MWAAWAGGADGGEGHSRKTKYLKKKKALLPSYVLISKNRHIRVSVGVCCLCEHSLF